MSDPKPVPFNPKAEAKEDPRLAAGALQGAEFVRFEWVARVAHGIRPEQLLVPEYWAHHAASLAPFAEIIVHAEDGSWYARYLVLDCSRTWAKVKPILGPVFLTTQDQSLTEASNAEVEAEKAKYQLTFRGQHKWSVVRLADKAVMHEGSQQKEDAAKELEKMARQAVGAPDLSASASKATA